MAGNWMIYGANGYTGRLILDLALANGHKPIIAGRNAQGILDLTRKTGLEGDVFDLSDHERTTKRLSGLSLVLNAAGPFSKTAHKLLTACLATKSQYLDITGEIDVFEDIFRREQECQTAGIAAIPGVGFDVVPTDTMAALLKAKMPDASHLTLAFNAHKGQPSPGTAKTMIEAVAKGGRVRRDGLIVGVPSGYKTGLIPFAEGSAMAVSIPWGDISTAYRTTGIPNIEVHMAASDEEIDRLVRAEGWRWLFSIPFVTKVVQRQVGLTIKGPSAESRQTGSVSLWAEAENPSGQKINMTMETPEGYTFTAASALKAVEHVLASPLTPGVFTPTQAFGTDFCLALPRVRVTESKMALS